MKRHAPPTRTPLPPRRAPIRQVSPAHARQQRAQRQAYGAALSLKWCEVCGVAGPVEHSHLFTQRQHPEHRNNPLNWILKCASCHRLWENHKAAFAACWPEAWALILHRMQQVDAVAFAFFQLKNPY